LALIQAENITITYEGLTAVCNVSFEVNPGDDLVIIGENGSGKSSVMKAMLGLVKVHGGKLIFGDGLKKNQVGYLPQVSMSQRDFPASVEEVVRSGFVSRMGFRLRYSKDDKLKALQAMDILQIMDLARRPYRELSGGQQQRVLLARAMCATDKVLLLDEPVSGLDPESAKDMYSMIRRLNRLNKTAIIMVSHDVDQALRDATHVLRMDQGRCFYGTVKEYREIYEEGIGANIHGVF